MSRSQITPHQKHAFSRTTFSRTTIAVVTLFAALSFPAASQDRRALITGKIDESQRHVLAGNTRPEANPQNDRGLVADDFPMEHMLLQLKRSPEQEQAVQQFIDALHNPQSPQFHKWLTAEEFGQKYGVAQEDIDTVRGWIESHGFTVNTVYPSGMLIDFSGTAGQVRAAFGTEIHYLEVNGRQHVANMSDPQIPEALSPVVAGVVSMHDFTPHAMKKSRADYTFTSGGVTTQAVTPGDLATIYNLSPLFNGTWKTNGPKLTGQGQTIAVIEDANLYSTADWNTFRSTFGLSGYPGTLTTVHPAPASGTTNCGNPGLGEGDDGEAIIDAEWASAAAPGANIVVAGCASTRSTWGGLIALQNLINSTNPPQIVSVSYGNCEAENGASSNAAFNAAYGQAVGEGISVFVSAGDEGAASCDAGATSATHGIGVSSWASTPNNVAVGGTDFGDSYAGTNSTYWNSTNTATYSSVKSYIPEIPWNDSCAGGLLTKYFDFTVPYGTNGFCGSTTARRDQFLGVVAGSGGPSGCATGTPSTSGVVSGSCKGYAKPSWQAGAGVPSDSVRDIPDVSLFAADGVWGHYYVTCWSDIRNGGAPCTGAPSGWAGAGGTSFSSPILAGIQALINQNLGGGAKGQGNPNYVYYQLASTSGIFHSVTQGDNAVNCGGTVNCFGAATTGGNGRRGGGSSGGNGVLSTSSGSYSPAYGTTAGWNFATGLGSVDATALVNNWPK
jgi:subtilase family serine protease